jgi:hypothetical protein
MQRRSIPESDNVSQWPKMRRRARNTHNAVTHEKGGDATMSAGGRKTNSTQDQDDQVKDHRYESRVSKAFCKRRCKLTIGKHQNEKRARSCRQDLATQSLRVPCAARIAQG